MSVVGSAATAQDLQTEVRMESGNSPAKGVRVLLDQRMDPLYAATVEATEEAILNSLCMADDMEGADGHFAPALPLEKVRKLVKQSKALWDGATTASSSR